MIGLIISIMLVPLDATAAVSLSIDVRDAWKGNSGEFAKAAQPGAGFSFRYDGDSVGPEFSRDWHQTFTNDIPSGATKTILTHQSGLLVTREMRVFPDSGAVEYKLYFKNTAKKTLPPVSEIQELNISFGQPVVDGNCVISSGGGGDDGFLPPRDFAIRKNCFAPTVPDDGAIELTAENGVSSQKDMPFFFIQNDARQEGVFVAFGWSGHWGTVIQRDGTRGILTVRGRIPELEIALKPGEEIQGPTVIQGVYLQNNI